MNEENENTGITFNEPATNLAIRHTMTNSSSKQQQLLQQQQYSNTQSSSSSSSSSSGGSNTYMHKYMPGISRHFYFPAQPVGGFTLSDLPDKPWSQVSSLPPCTCLQFLSRMGFSIPTARRFSSNVANSRSRAFR